MSDFSKQPSELQLEPVDIIAGDVCEGCYYYAEETQGCWHPESPLGDGEGSCSVDNGLNGYDNYIFIVPVADSAEAGEVL